MGGVWLGQGTASVSAGLRFGAVKVVTAVRCTSNGDTAIVEHTFATIGLQAGFGAGFGIKMAVTGAPTAADLMGSSSGLLAYAGVAVGLRAGWVDIRIDTPGGATYTGGGFVLGAGLAIPATVIYLNGFGTIVSTHCKPCKKWRMAA